MVARIVGVPQFRYSLYNLRQAAWGGPAGTAIASMISAVEFIAGVINWMKNNTSIPDALRSLQGQNDEVKFVLGMRDTRPP